MTQKPNVGPMLARRLRHRPDMCSLGNCSGSGHLQVKLDYCNSLFHNMPEKDTLDYNAIRTAFKICFKNPKRQPTCTLTYLFGRNAQNIYIERSACANT